MYCVFRTAKLWKGIDLHDMHHVWFQGRKVVISEATMKTEPTAGNHKLQWVALMKLYPSVKISWNQMNPEKPWKAMKKAWWFCLVHRFLSVCVIRFIAFFRWKNPFPQGPLPSIGKMVPLFWAIERTTIDGARFQHVPGAATWPGPLKAGDLPLAIFHMWRMEIPQWDGGYGKIPI